MAALPDRQLRRKLTLRAEGQKVVFVKHRKERLEHVLMKAFLWALYLPQYPDLSVEIRIGDRYKPDVVQLDPVRGAPVFWGEAGKVSADKVDSLVRRFPRTHFAMAKWGESALDPFAALVREALAEASSPRRAPFDLIALPEDAADRFIDEKGTVRLTHDDLMWERIEASG